jgi:hypothetical protein
MAEARSARRSVREAAQLDPFNFNLAPNSRFDYNQKLA